MLVTMEKHAGQCVNGQIAQAGTRWVLAHQEMMGADSLDSWHAHDWYQLMYASEGVLTAKTEQQALVVPPQRAFWIPPGVSHCAYALKGAQFKSLYFRPDKPRCLGTVGRVLAVTPLIRELILAVVARCAAQADWTPQDEQLAEVLLHQMSIQPNAPFTLVMPRDERLASLVHTLQNNPGDETSMAAWADRLGLSSRTLARCFIRETGLGFREWRQKLRLLHAITLLDRGISVTEVALEIGYQSPSAFINSFRQAFGATPTAYIQR